MATNSERGRRFDLRTTIPLATETLVSLAKRPKRSWLLPALTLLAGIAFALTMLELMFYPGPVTALAFEGELSSRIMANYGADPVMAKIHELRLTIVQDVLGGTDGSGSGNPVVAMLLLDPVPTATPASTKGATATSGPSASPAPSESPTDIPMPSNTPSAPPTETPGAPASYCDLMSISAMWVHSSDEVRATVRNNGGRDAYLTNTVFEWPDVPDPTYVDWFKFDDDKYYDIEDGSSPTTSSGSWEKIKKWKTETWQVDFDDKPDGGIYGSFALTLTFAIPGEGTCTMSRSTFKDIPVPSPVPSDTPEPTDTPEPSATDTPEPAATDTPEPVPTDTPVPAPTDTPEPVPTDTPVPAPTETPG